MTQLATRPNGTALVAQGGFIPTYDLAGIQSAGEMLFASGFFQDTRSAAQAIVKVMAGAELGIPPFAAMQGIHIIKGKPTLSAGLMAGKVKSSGRYDFRVVENTDKAVEIHFFQNGEKIGESRFTIEDARRAETQNLGKFPRNMLYARAMSNGVKWHCPDIFLGPIYTPEEMGATVNEEGEVIEIQGREVSRVTGEIMEPRTPVQSRRTSDPQQYKHERIDGELIHEQVIDPATNRPAVIKRNEENEHYAPRSTEQDAVLGKHIGSVKGWMVNKKLDPEDGKLMLHLLNQAASDLVGEPWTSRKQLSEENWALCKKVLFAAKTPELNQWVQSYVETKNDDGNSPFSDEHVPPGIEPCPACGRADLNCLCTPEEVAQARADREGAEQSEVLDMDVPEPAKPSNTAAFNH